MFELNVFALWYTTRPALAYMKKQGAGHILTMASIAGKVGFPFNSAYVAAKHAAAGFTYALRAELPGTGIHASVIYPASVRTDWADVTEGHPMKPLFTESGPIVKRIAAERGVALPKVEGVIPPERVAEAVLRCILIRSLTCTRMKDRGNTHSSPLAIGRRRSACSCRSCWGNGRCTNRTGTSDVRRDMSGPRRLTMLRH